MLFETYCVLFDIITFLLNIFVQIFINKSFISKWYHKIIRISSIKIIILNLLYINDLLSYPQIINILYTTYAQVINILLTYYTQKIYYCKKILQYFII